MSLIVLSGESALTYQYKSPVPVNAGSRMRTGAPLAKARKTPATPTPAPRSALPAMTGCIVSPAPWVPTFSSTRLWRLKIPASWPSVGRLVFPIIDLSDCDLELIFGARCRTESARREHDERKTKATAQRVAREVELHLLLLF